MTERMLLLIDDCTTRSAQRTSRPERSLGLDAQSVEDFTALLTSAGER